MNKFLTDCTPLKSIQRLLKETWRVTFQQTVDLKSLVKRKNIHDDQIKSATIKFPAFYLTLCLLVTYRLRCAEVFTILHFEEYHFPFKRMLYIVNRAFFILNRTFFKQDKNFPFIHSVAFLGQCLRRMVEQCFFKLQIRLTCFVNCQFYFSSSK